jgi:hypothetical protein
MGEKISEISFHSRDELDVSCRDDLFNQDFREASNKASYICEYPFRSQTRCIVLNIVPLS